MAKKSAIITGSTVAALVAALDAFFAAHPTAIYTSFDLVATEMVRTIGLDLAVAIGYDDAGGNDLTLTPITSHAFLTTSAEALGTQADTYIAANPARWYKGPWIGWMNQVRRSEGWFGLMLTSAGVTATVDANWTC